MLVTIMICILGVSDIPGVHLQGLSDVVPLHMLKVFDERELEVNE